jgi:hypothetical protein
MSTTKERDSRVAIAASDAATREFAEYLDIEGIQGEEARDRILRCMEMSVMFAAGRAAAASDYAADGVEGLEDGYASRYQLA